MFRDLERAGKAAFSGIAGHMPFGVNIAMPGQAPLSGDGLLVSGSYFPVLGIQPALGRWLGSIPLFAGPPMGIGFMPAGIVLAIMILPTITLAASEATAPSQVLCGLMRGDMR